MTGLLALEGVAVRYPGARTPALQGVSLTVEPGAGVGILGEAGAGKSTLAALLLGLRAPTAGQVLLDGEPLTATDADRRRALRRTVQPLFPDPFGSLDPRQRVDAIIAEPLKSLDLERSGRARRETVRQLLAEVELDASAATRFPHEFSPGQRQRIGIARALAAGPQLLVADEPVDALDASARVEVLALLDRLRDRHGLALVVASHDLAVVAALCEEVVVLSKGHIVESGATLEVIAAPRQPETAALVAATPRLGISLARPRTWVHRPTS